MGSANLSRLVASTGFGKTPIIMSIISSWPYMVRMSLLSVIGAWQMSGDICSSLQNFCLRSAQIPSTDSSRVRFFPRITQLNGRLANNKHPWHPGRAILGYLAHVGLRLLSSHADSLWLVRCTRIVLHLSNHQIPNTKRICWQERNHKKLFWINI